MSHLPEGIAAIRLLVEDALTSDNSDAASQDAGTPRIVDTPVTSVHEVEVGLWQIEAGAVDDVEVDEVFLVLAGSGQVVFHDGSILRLRPGVLVRLVEGDQTTWEIDEPLRKLYVTWPNPRPSRPRGDTR